MIELTDYRGNKVLIHNKDIREVNGYFDGRYPNIQSVIILYDGKKIECSLPYNVVKNLTLQRVRGSLSVDDCKHLMYYGKAKDGSLGIDNGEKHLDYFLSNVFELAKTSTRFDTDKAEKMFWSRIVALANYR